MALSTNEIPRSSTVGQSLDNSYYRSLAEGALRPQLRAANAQIDEQFDPTRVAKVNRDTPVLGHDSGQVEPGKKADAYLSREFEGVKIPRPFILPGEEWEIYEDGLARLVAKQSEDLRGIPFS